jgi:UDP-N-acetyl-D-glucosamine dehydrogenase
MTVDAADGRTDEVTARPEAVVDSRSPRTGRPVVAVQGLGFVGSAMAVAVASARNDDGGPAFDVVGVDLPTPDGNAKIAALNAGRLPFETTDLNLRRKVEEAHRIGNLVATSDPRAYEQASVVVVDVPLDVVRNGARPTVDFGPFRKAIRTLARHMTPGALVLVETTVPPGTCEKVVVPELAGGLVERGLPRDALLVAHSYERVMPGPAYLESITHFWRSYAGHTPAAAAACEAFLSQVIDVENYPLTRLGSTTASEMGKVIENSYRATTIALMEEWGRFAEATGVDLFEVIEGIRRRPTHSNIRQPGFGVGGYCLTKDPLFGPIGANELFDLDLEFPFSSLAVTVNEHMPLVTVDKLEALLGERFAGARILLMGVSYRSDVADTRSSPSEVFVRAARERGAEVVCHDPLVAEWPELGARVHRDLPTPAGFDAVVFAVNHLGYADLDFRAWLNGDRPIVFDANAVLTERQRAVLADLGCPTGSIGRGSR